MAGRIKKQAIEPFEDKELEDYEREFGDEFLKLFVNLMEKTDSQKKCKAESMQTFLSLHNHKLTQDEILYIYKLIKVRFEKPKEEADALTVTLTKEMGVAELHKMLADPNCKGELRLKVLDKIGLYSNWEEDKDAELILKSNNELMATLNKLFTIQEQEFIAFNPMDEEIIIGDAEDEDVSESTLHSIEVI